MTALFSLNHRNGRKFPHRRAFRKALGETVSVAQGASLFNVGRTTLYKWRNTLPGFASAGQEAASSNESFGVQRLMARHRKIPFGINRLAAGTHRAIDENPCPTDSPWNAKRRF